MLDRNIILFHRYTRMGASSRLRLIQFYPFFKKLSILYYFSFSNDYYLRLVYKKKFIINLNILKLNIIMNISKARVDIFIAYKTFIN